MSRPDGEVPFPDRSWLKRYHGETKWNDIAGFTAIREIRQYFYPEDWERMTRNAEVGGMVLNLKYFDLMFIQDSAYQDEL